MIRMLYLRWHRRQLLAAINSVKVAIAGAEIELEAMEHDLRRVAAELARAETEKRWKVAR